jgi:hypothetical protein
MAGPINGSRMEEQGGSTGDDHLNVMTRRSPASLEGNRAHGGQTGPPPLWRRIRNADTGEKENYVA